MTVVVQKYGGSSVADVERLGKVADKVVATRRSGVNVVVVVSAMGKTTDQLLALAKEVDENPPRRELDMLLTTGERVSMALLSMAIQKRGEPAVSFTGSQSGIITNDRHFDARIIEVRPHRLEDELARGSIVIVAGYQGMSYRREITTLGRGGSDTTAIALAAALGAEHAEIYSDVDGVYSADPRVVPDAQHLPGLGYSAMQEMAEVGAKVLNQTAVELAKKAGIAIHARATFAPGRETLIQGGVGEEARSVVGQQGVVRLSVPDETSLRRALEILSEASLPARDVVSDARGASLTVATALTPDWQKVRAALSNSAAVTGLDEMLGCASVVGVTCTALGSACDALKEHGIVWSAVTTGGTRVSMLVEQSATDDAVRALHARFVAT